MRKILVPTANTASAYETAEYVMAIAKTLNAELHVLHVMQDESEVETAEASLKVFELASEEPAVTVKGSLRVGNVVREIVEYAENNKIDLVVMGASNGQVVDQWLSHDVLGRSAVPVLVLPFQILEN